ncbi:hepatocyte growth factor-regulated tyrosine kinase substrate domain-containing protein [Ditylenchus destructor]|nr:hepatocyte growth factor-regulated tyrosine kinase substrate domain-containing protein [Ditylenchus destructor]
MTSDAKGRRTSLSSVQGDNLYPTVHDDITECICDFDGESFPEAFMLEDYLDRRFWDQKHDKTENQINANSVLPLNMFNDASQPAHLSTNSSADFADLDAQQQITLYQTDRITDTNYLISSASELINTMDSRMYSNHLRGFVTWNEKEIQPLASHLSNTHKHVLSLMTKLESEREYLMELQNRLAYIQEVKLILTHSRSVSKYYTVEFLKNSRQKYRGDLMARLHQIKVDLNRETALITDTSRMGASNVNNGTANQSHC